MLDGVVVPLTLATSLILPFALLLEALVAGNLADDVLRSPLDPLSRSGRFFANTLVVAGFSGIVWIVAVVELIHDVSSQVRA